MLIKCPACQARATLPDTKQGAKVKCGECGRVFVARLPGDRIPQGSGSTTALAIGGTAVALVLLAAFLLNRPASKAPRAATPASRDAAPVEEVSLDSTGWDSAPVRAAVALHEAVHEGDREAVRAMLHGPRRFAWVADEAGMTAVAFDALSRPDQLAHLDEWADDLTTGKDEELVGDWEPYDGEVAVLTDDEATVRVSVTPRDSSAGFEQRWVQWRLAREGREWKAFAWEPWISEKERERRARRESSIAKVTLSDGSVVLESEPEPLGHLDTTPPELRRRIDELFATATDLDLTVEAGRAQQELVAIGRPAIPILLTGMFETPLDTEEDAIRVNIMVTALREITGVYKGYEPQVLVGSSTGTTEERRRSAIRQWFAWWELHEDDFETIAEAQDGLEGLIELSDEEERWLERHKD